MAQRQSSVATARVGPLPTNSWAPAIRDARSPRPPTSSTADASWATSPKKPRGAPLREKVAMQGAPTNPTSPDRVVVHPLDAGDAAIAAAARAATKAVKGVRLGVEGRGQYDAFMEGVSPAEGLKVEKGAVGGVQGVWARPAHARPDEAILYLHGGWFNFGSAWAYRSFVGHFAKRARANAFIVDYRLAPEHPFPAAIDDALASYRALGAQGVRRIAVVGDSAGGNLTLTIASRVIGDANSTPATLVGAVAFSPLTDLTLSGASYGNRQQHRCNHRRRRHALRAPLTALAALSSTLFTRPPNTGD